MAHNPEVVGSNPTPATKVRNRIRTRIRSLALLGHSAKRQKVRFSAVFDPEGGQRFLVELVVREVVLVSYAPKLAAALSGATIRQLAYWRKPGHDGQPILAPEYSAIRPIDYSFRDVIALRTCVRLRQETSLQKTRRALDTLRVDLGERDHLSSYQLVADGSTIYFADSDHAVDLLRQKGNVVIHQFVEVLQPFYVQGRQIPALLEPREHVQVDPGVRGGEPVKRC
jgi:hypothetical protein